MFRWGSERGVGGGRVAMTAITEEFLQEIARKIVEEFHPRRIVLFGSRARGEGRGDSDVDLFVEMESDLRPSERAARVGRVFGLRDWSLDLVVYTPEEVKKHRDVHGALMSIIEREGRVLYDRPSEQLHAVDRQG